MIMRQPQRLKKHHALFNADDTGISKPGVLQVFSRRGSPWRGCAFRGARSQGVFLEGRTEIWAMKSRHVGNVFPPPARRFSLRGAPSWFQFAIARGSWPRLALRGQLQVAGKAVRAELRRPDPIASAATRWPLRCTPGGLPCRNSSMPRSRRARIPCRP